MTHPQTHTAEAGDVTTLREADAFVERFMATSVEIAGAEIKARFNNGTHEEIERIGRQKERIASTLRTALAASFAPRAPAAVPEEVPPAPTADIGMKELRDTLKELTEAADEMIAFVPGHWHDDHTIRLTDAAEDANKVLKAAEQDDLYETSPRTLAAAPAAPPADGGTEGLREAFASFSREHANYFRPSLEDTFNAGWNAALSSRTPAGAAGDPVGENDERKRTPDLTDAIRAAHGEWLKSPAGKVYGGDDFPAFFAGYGSGMHHDDATRPASPAPAASAGGEGASLAGGIFTEWTTADLAGQCRMQSREMLDPELSRFFIAVADRLAALAPAAQANPGREEIARIGFNAWYGAGDRGYAAYDERPEVQDQWKRIADAILAARPVAEGDAGDGWQKDVSAHLGVILHVTDVPEHKREDAEFLRGVLCCARDYARAAEAALPAARPAPSPAKGGNEA